MPCSAGQDRLDRIHVLMSPRIALLIFNSEKRQKFFPVSFVSVLAYPRKETIHISLPFMENSFRQEREEDAIESEARRDEEQDIGPFGLDG